MKYCDWCKTEHEFCQSCGIGIGHKHTKMETFSYKGKQVCDSCYTLLTRRDNG